MYVCLYDSKPIVELNKTYIAELYVYFGIILSASSTKMHQLNNDNLVFHVFIKIGMKLSLNRIYKHLKLAITAKNSFKISIYADGHLNLSRTGGQKGKKV